jgi:hypothetical protein
MAAWDAHRDLMGTPTVLGVAVLSASVSFDWWLHIGACLIALVLFAPVHRSIFGSISDPRRRNDVLVISVVIACQIAAWSLVFFAVKGA